MKFNEAEFESVYAKAAKQNALNSVSPKDKWNLKMDVEEVKKDFNELQNATEKLPDNFVKEMCSTDSYPFEEPVDEVTDMNQWCNEVDDFLKDTENFGMPKKH